MRHRSRTAGLLAGLSLILTLAGPALAAAPTHDPGPRPARTVHALTTHPLRLDATECTGRSLSASAGHDPAGGCTATVTFEMTASGVPSTVAATGVSSTASTCSITWAIISLRATVQSIFGGFFWSATANATGYGDSCGRVLWTSVTCDQHGIGYAVSIDWCGAYPGRWAWYPYTSSNIGLNITLSAVANGVPISWTHGARNGFNPYTGTQYGFFAW